MSRDNITGYGGDPARIKLLGQSARGGAVGRCIFLRTSFRSNCLSFHWGIRPKINTLQEASVYWYNVPSTVGCGDPSSNALKLLACMKTKSYNLLLDAIPSISGALGSSPFIPLIDKIVVFSHYLARAAAGNSANFPCSRETTTMKRVSLFCGYSWSHVSS